MKKLIIGLAGASVMFAVPAAAAPGHHGNDRGRYEQVQKRANVRVKQVVKVRQAQARKWQRGQRFDRRYATNYRVIQNPRAYNLYNAPRGYRWVQSDNDAVLIAVTSGIIGAIIGNAF